MCDLDGIEEEERQVGIKHNESQTHHTWIKKILRDSYNFLTDWDSRGLGGISSQSIFFGKFADFAAIGSWLLHVKPTKTEAEANPMEGFCLTLKFAWR